MTRRLTRLCTTAVLACLVGALWTGASGSSAARPLSPPQQTPVPQAPIFRAGTNLVTVDAYPLLDGRVVQGLSKDDFEVLEDGKPQKIDSFEFLRIEPTPDAEHHDPNTVGESLKAAADPHNRVFVVYLDTHFVRVDGSHSIQRPLAEMVNRILAPNDLFGVLTPRMRPSDVTLGRLSTTMDAELGKHWPWGMRDSLKILPEGQLADACYVQNGLGALASSIADPQPIRPIPGEILERSWEEQTLARLDELILFLGKVREARSSAMVVTDGWRLYQPDDGLATLITDPKASKGTAGTAPGIFLGPGGRMGLGASHDSRGDTKDPTNCTTELLRLARIDDRQKLHDVIARANRNNVTFYTVNPSGLAVWDTPPATRPSSQYDVAADATLLSSRVDSVTTLANATDGIAITNTNDLKNGLKRIVDEVSAYYLLGYYSTNTKLDGKYRRIDVHVHQPKVKVTARRGYTAGVEGATPPGAPTPAAAGGPGIAEALATLARVRPEAEIVTVGALRPNELSVVAELASAQIESGRWDQGGDVSVIVSDVAGQALPPVRGRIDPGTRGALIHVPVGAGAAGPWLARVTVTGSAGTLDDRVDIRTPSGPLLGGVLMYRGTPAAQSALRPVADAAFRRTERVHLEWTLLQPLDRREARLLGRTGQPLAVAVTLTERDVSGQPGLAADTNLGPLAPGDYVIELVAGAGAAVERQLIAIRVVR